MNVEPGILRWRQRTLWRRFVARLYVLGAISCYVDSGHKDGWITHNLGWRGRRPYVLGLQRKTWGYPFHWLRYRHWPEPVWGMCGKCAPWPCCGATGWDHADDCEGEPR